MSSTSKGLIKGIEQLAGDVTEGAAAVLKRNRLKVLQEIRINPKEEVQPPQVCLQIIDSESACDIATLGDISLVIGKAKSRKTFYTTLALAATASNDIVLHKFKGCLPANKRDVYFFDTEQGRHDTLLVVKRVCRMMNIEVPANFHAFPLRKFAPAERLEMIEAAIYDNDQLGFVVIDGVRDLVTSINDEEQATAMASKLLKWTEERNIHILTVLHQNKGDSNARGHLGAELVNKAQTVLSITKSEEDKELSIVEAEYCRGKDFETFAFQIDCEGLPMIADNWQIKTATNRQKASEAIKDITDIICYQILTECFTYGEEFSYTQLAAQIKLASQKILGRAAGNNDISDLITRCKNSNWLLQPGFRKPYKLGSFKSPALSL